MSQWLKQMVLRLTGRQEAGSAQRTPHSEPRPPAAAAPRPAAAPAPGGAQTVAVGVGARRPLLATDGHIAGFEFRLHERMRERLDPRTDVAACKAHAAALISSARAIAATGSIGLARLPLSWAGVIDAGQAARGVMVALESRPSAQEPAVDEALSGPVITALQAAGAKVGWLPQTRLTQRADFVLWRAGEQPMAGQLTQRASWPADLQGLPVVATDVASLADIEQALAQGIALVCGALTSGPTPGDAKDRMPLPPDAQRLGTLLSQLVAGADTAVIATQIKADVGLSVRLFGRLNSAAFSHVRKDGSIDQLIMLLGRNELYRWLSVLMLQYMGKRQAGSALQQAALWRARTMELLAVARKEPAPQEFFTLGLASMLGLLLQVSDEDAAQALCLGQNGRLALLQRAGPWAGYLATVLALERGQALDEAAAQPFGGVDVVAALSDQAWAWVEAHSPGAQA